MTFGHPKHTSNYVIPTTNHIKCEVSYYKCTSPSFHSIESHYVPPLSIDTPFLFNECIGVPCLMDAADQFFRIMTHRIFHNNVCHSIVFVRFQENFPSNDLLHPTNPDGTPIVPDRQYKAGTTDYHYPALIYAFHNETMHHVFPNVN